MNRRQARQTYALLERCRDELNAAAERVLIPTPRFEAAGRNFEATGYVILRQSRMAPRQHGVAPRRAAAP